MDNKPHHMIVFTTNKTLNERFTPKNERSVFMLNNGDSSMVKDNDVSSSVNGNDERNIQVCDCMEKDEICSTDNICSTPNQINIEENEEKAKVPPILQARNEEKFWKPANLRNRYRSQSYTNLIDLTESNGTWNNKFRVNKRNFPLKSRPRYLNSRLPFRGVRRYYRTNNRFRRYNERYKRPNYQNFCLSKRYCYIRPFPYKWGRRRCLITKEQLDDEIDKYMADVLFHTPCINTDETDENENYLNETEQFLKAYENV